MWDEVKKVIANDIKNLTIYMVVLEVNYTP